MKLIIDIPEETYRRIQALANVDYFEHDICGYSMKRIAKGTPYKEKPQLSDEQLDKIADLLETEWGYEGIREDVARIMRETDND